MLSGFALGHWLGVSKLPLHPALCGPKYSCQHCPHSSPGRWQEGPSHQHPSSPPLLQAGAASEQRLHGKSRPSTTHATSFLSLYDSGLPGFSGLCFLLSLKIQILTLYWLTLRTVRDSEQHGLKVTKSHDPLGLSLIFCKMSTWPYIIYEVQPLKPSTKPMNKWNH